MQPAPLLKTPSVLAESFLTEALIDRKHELAELRRALLPLVNRRTPRNVWVHGPPGCGKTSVVKFVLNESEDRHGILGVYVNCWETATWHSVLDRITRDLRILSADRLNSVYKMERLEHAIRGKALVVVLDEIDRPVPRDRDAIIYNLCSMPNVALMCICNSRYYYQLLDERVKSRLAAMLLEFNPYPTQAIRAILDQRAALSLMVDAAQPEVLRRIVALPTATLGW